MIPDAQYHQFKGAGKFIARVKAGAALLLVTACIVGYGAGLAQADDEPMTLSLQSAVLFALEESMRINVTKAQAEQAKYAIDEAKSSYMPQIEMSSEIGGEFNDPGVFKAGDAADGSNVTRAGGMRMSLRQMIFDGPAISEVARRRKAAESADIVTEVTSQGITNDTIGIYLDIYKFQNEYINAKGLVKALDYYVSRLQQAVDAGAESEAKFKYAKARLDLALNRIASAEASLNESMHKLQRYTGPLPIFVATRPVELNLLDYDVDFLQAMASSQNPELILADTDIQTGALDLKRQQREYLPKLNFVMEGRQDQNFGALREREGRAMLQMTYNISTGGARDAAMKRLKSRVKELEYEKEDSYRVIKTEISTLYSEVLSDREKATLKQKEAMSYIALQKINHEALDQGDLDIFEVIENEERLSNAKSELNQLDVSLYNKSYDLLQYIGALKKQRFCESC